MQIVDIYEHTYIHIIHIHIILNVRTLLEQICDAKVSQIEINMRKY